MTLFSDVTHPIRVRILKLLFDKPRSLAGIARNLELSKPEISRHLAKLRELNLTETSERTHHITNLGEAIVSFLSPLDFIIDHYDFFRTHSFHGFPPSLLREIEALSKSELLVGFGYILKEVEATKELTAREFKLMVDQPFPFQRRALISKGEYIVPSHAREENLQLDSLKQFHESFEFRTLPAVNFVLALGIGEINQAFLFFPDMTGKPDANSAFHVKDPIGIEYLQNVWNHFWERSKRRIQFDKT